MNVWPFGGGELARLIREKTWAETPLGASRDWSSRIKAAVEIVLGSPLVSSIALTTERLLIYNDAAAHLYGDAHPAALGRPLAESFPETYAAVAAIYDRVFEGDTVEVKGQPLALGGAGGGEVFDAYLTPLRDEDGIVIGVHMVGLEIGQQLRDAAALRDSEERFRAFVTASADVLYRMSPDWSEMRGLDGKAFLRDTGEPSAEWLDGYILPDDQAQVRAAIDRAIAAKTVFEHEHRVIRADGSPGFTKSRAVPILDQSGEIREWLGAASDVTSEKAIVSYREEAEASIAASETRLRTLMEGIPQLVWRSCDQGLWTWASPQWLDFTGQSQEESHGSGWLEAVHLDDWSATRMAWLEARPHGILDVEYRVRRAADGAWLWHHTRSLPVRNTDGHIVEWLGTSTDIQDLRELQERQQVLVAELQHRTFNLMGVIRSVADATLRSSATTAEFRLKFRNRIDALARVQRLLSRLAEGERITFDDLIRGELTAAGLAEGDDRVSLGGPRGVALRSRSVQTFAMALHELTTNALKYGALAQADARLEVRWRTASGEDDQPWLHVDWTESGVDMPLAATAPAGSGQGRILIEEALPYQFGARTTFVMTRDGVHCSIGLPVSRREPSRA